MNQLEPNNRIPFHTTLSPRAAKAIDSLAKRNNTSRGRMIERIYNEWCQNRMIEREKAESEHLDLRCIRIYINSINVRLGDIEKTLTGKEEKTTI